MFLLKVNILLSVFAIIVNMLHHIGCDFSYFLFGYLGNSLEIAVAVFDLGNVVFRNGLRVHIIKISTDLLSS